ncbi:MAG TPA: phosphoribosylglycinamide formyltransferase [bacterium]|nr:phosphoribosylglycinamide formyltransferase [bacterium]
MFTIGVLASGKGSNLKAIIDYIKNRKLPIKIGVVISDNPGSYALEIAKNEGLNNLYIAPGRYRTFMEPDAERKTVETLINNRVDLVCLAGFMRVLKKHFIESFRNRIVNIHPSLLPAFPGLESWKQALDYGVKFAGCTTHFVEDKIDAGPIIMQAVVPVLKDDSPGILHARIQEKEHIIYPLTVRLIAEGRLSISGKKVYINS